MELITPVVPSLPWRWVPLVESLFKKHGDGEEVARILIVDVADVDLIIGCAEQAPESPSLSEKESTRRSIACDALQELARADPELTSQALMKWKEGVVQRNRRCFEDSTGIIPLLSVLCHLPDLNEVVITLAPMRNRAAITCADEYLRRELNLLDFGDKVRITRATPRDAGPPPAGTTQGYRGHWICLKVCAERNQRSPGLTAALDIAARLFAGKVIRESNGAVSTNTPVLSSPTGTYETPKWFMKATAGLREEFDRACYDAFEAYRAREPIHAAQLLRKHNREGALAQLAAQNSARQGSCVGSHGRWAPDTPAQTAAQAYRRACEVREGKIDPVWANLARTHADFFRTCRLKRRTSILAVLERKYSYKGRVVSGFQVLDMGGISSLQCLRKLGKRYKYKSDNAAKWVLSQSPSYGRPPPERDLAKTLAWWNKKLSV